MDDRQAKLDLARKKLKNHQEKKLQNDSKNSSANRIINEVVDNSNNTNHVLPNHENTNHVLPNHKNIAEHHDPELQLEQKNKSNDINTKVTELFIAKERDFESKIHELQQKLTQLEFNYSQLSQTCDAKSRQNAAMETELQSIQSQYSNIYEQLGTKNKHLEEYKSTISKLTDDQLSLTEQLEFTKNVLKQKELENSSLSQQLDKLKTEFESMQLYLQQITNGQNIVNPEEHQNDDKSLELLNTIATLEQKLKISQKENSEIKAHYEHYVSELNEEINVSGKKHFDALNQIEILRAREQSLIQQISCLEVTLQNLNRQAKMVTQNNANHDHFSHLVEKQKEECINLQEKYLELKARHDELIALLTEKQNIITELESRSADENVVSVSKLNIDIENDKIAAQRATEQNKKLKIGLHELEEAFIKISKDKLELTEKLEAEKFLNRELTLKLADVADNAKDLKIKLDAKDKEMLRLQSSYRDQDNKAIPEVTDQIEETHHCTHSTDHKEDHDDSQNSNHIDCEITNNGDTKKVENSTDLKDILRKEEAMSKLQTRFLRIMDEVANLSDEKHRLEHIITQLQNETDTICEYVALYQQQRSLLKHRDEERTHQLKLFQTECDKLKFMLSELNDIVYKLANDNELSKYFEQDSRREDIERILCILQDMKNNFLIQSNTQYLDMKRFFPCACCSGNLIDV